MKLFGSKPTQTIEVTVDQAALRPGDAVHATIRIVGTPDKKVRSAVARLSCAQRWAQETNDEDGRSISWKVDTVVAAEKILFAEGQPIEAGEHIVEFILPNDAVASAVDAVTWNVEGIISRHLGNDIRGAAHPTVLKTAQQNGYVATNPPVDQHDPFFHIEAASRTLRSGDVVSGKVVLHPTTDVRVKELFVNLQLERLDAKDLAKSGSRYRTVRSFSKVTLAEELSMPAGAEKDLPFEVRIPPAEMPPTLFSPHTRLAWWVVAIAKTPMLQHNHIQQLELNVYNDPESL